MTTKDILEAERAKRAALLAESRNVIDRASDEKRDLTTAEDARFQALVNEADQVTVRISGLEKTIAGEALGRDVRALLGDASSVRNSGYPRPTDFQVTGRTNEGSRDMSITSHDPIRSMIEAHEGQADFDIVRGLHETRAIADFSDSASLYTSDFATKVAMYLRTESPWVNLATIVNADNGRPLVIPTETADPTAYTPGEGTAITESTPTLGTAQATPVSYKVLSYLSAESVEDSEISLSDLLARTAARSIGLQLGSAITTAVVAAINNGGTATGLGGGSTATYIGYEDLIDLKLGRAAPYRASGVWIMSNSMIKKARKWRDQYGEYLWQPNISQGQPSLDGQAVFEDPYLASVGSASKSVLYGEVAAAVTIKMSPLRVSVSDQFRFSNDQTSVKTVLRAGAAIADPAALAYLVAANA